MGSDEQTGTPEPNPLSLEARTPLPAAGTAALSRGSSPEEMLWRGKALGQELEES